MKWIGRRARVEKGDGTYYLKINSKEPDDTPVAGHIEDQTDMLSDTYETRQMELGALNKEIVRASSEVQKRTRIVERNKYGQSTMKNSSITEQSHPQSGDELMMPSNRHPTQVYEVYHATDLLPANASKQFL